MKLTYADVLTVLPVDVTLQDYLTRCALPLPPALDWTDAVSSIDARSRSHAPPRPRLAPTKPCHGPI